MPRHEVPAVRLLPMSDKVPAFRPLSIEDVQERLFLRELPRNGGAYHYRGAGLNADPWTVVLFQFKARVIASATFLRDERFDEPRGPGRAWRGAIHFDPGSFRTFDPVDVATMRLAWPHFAGFGHVKRFLNAEGYEPFRERLTHVRRPIVSRDERERPQARLKTRS